MLIWILANLIKWCLWYISTLLSFINNTYCCMYWCSAFQNLKCNTSCFWMLLWPYTILVENNVLFRIFLVYLALTCDQYFMYVFGLSTNSWKTIELPHSSLKVDSKSRNLHVLSISYKWIKHERRVVILIESKSMVMEMKDKMDIIKEFNKSFIYNDGGLEGGTLHEA